MESIVDKPSRLVPLDARIEIVRASSVVSRSRRKTGCSPGRLSY